MPIYGYECEFCDYEMEEFRPIKDGPRQGLRCPVCDESLILQLSCNFILKGQGWPGKDINKDVKLSETAEKAEQFVEDHDSKKKESKEVLMHRRMGKKHFKEWKKHNAPAIERYSKNLQEGIKGQNA